MASKHKNVSIETKNSRWHLPFHNQGGVRVFTPEYNFFFLSEWKYNFFFLSEWKYNFFFITNPSIVLLYDRTRMIL